MHLFAAAAPLPSRRLAAPLDHTEEMCARLGRQLARAEARAALGRARRDPSTPSHARVAIRVLRFCKERGLRASVCLEAHRAAQAGLPHDTLLASLYRRAALAAHRPRPGR